jgi:hypothetical protein
MWRELTTARGGVSAKPKAKGSGGASRERALIVAAKTRPRQGSKRECRVKAVRIGVSCSAVPL